MTWTINKGRNIKMKWQEHGKLLTTSSNNKHSIRIHHFDVETMLIYPTIFQYLLTNGTQHSTRWKLRLWRLNIFNSISEESFDTENVPFHQLSSLLVDNSIHCNYFKCSKSPVLFLLIIFLVEETEFSC